MKNRFLNKRGELSTQQIVLLIIVIASFVVILFFLMRLGFEEKTDEEICHQSVVMRASGKFGKSSPLDCKVKYLCITEDGSCDSLSDPKIEKVSTEEEVYQILADELADCWWMFGEGKLDYVGKDLDNKNYCSICAQLAFDDSVKSNIFSSGKIDRKKIYEYLSNNKMEGGEKTYFEYLYGGNDLNSLENELKNEGVDFGEIDISKQHYLLMGITSKVNTWAWIGIGAGALAVAPFSLVGGGIAAAITGGVYFLTQGSGGEFISPIVEGESGNEFLSPTLVEVNSEEFKALNCDSIETLA